MPPFERNQADYPTASDYHYDTCITYIMWPYMVDQSHYQPAYTYFTCGTPGMQQVQRLFSESSNHDNPTNNGGAVNGPNMIGGVVGGLSALGLLLLGFLFLRRKRRETTNDPDEQACRADDQRTDPAAIELPPDTTKSELQCSSSRSVTRDRGSIQSPRTGLEVQEGQTSYLSPVCANSNMIPPISELAAPNEAAGREAEHSNMAFKTHESGKRSLITDRITI